jgi:Putative DNA-binding domain
MRARFVSAMWVPGKLKMQLEMNIPTEQVELQVVHSDSADPWQEMPAFNGPAEIGVPDDCRKLFLYLIHNSGEQIAQLQLSSLYESKGDVDPVLSLSSQAEMELGRGETERVEFKPFISPNNSKETEVVETVIAFANTNGGRIYFGVRDQDGVPLGTASLVLMR